MTTIVAIHQPNYAPWLGYFYKIAQSDVFIFLDDAQYTRNSFINRVQIAGEAGPKWLTVPVSYSFGDTIAAVVPANGTWRRSHLDKLKTLYKSAESFKTVWNEISAMYEELPGGNLAMINGALIKRFAERLGLKTEFRASSSFDATEKGDDRLIRLINTVAPNSSYLSGRGGEKYQDPNKFAVAGIELRYTDFSHPMYEQGRADFLPGLSVLDAVFHLGWSGTADLLKTAAVRSS